MWAIVGALTRHLQNYSRKYTELYPHATQIIVKCPPSFFWTSERTQVGNPNQCLRCLLSTVVAKPTLACRGSPRRSRLSSTDRQFHPESYSRSSSRPHTLIFEWYGCQRSRFTRCALTGSTRWWTPTGIPRPFVILQISIHFSLGAPRQRTHPRLVPWHWELPFHWLGIQHCHTESSYPLPCVDFYLHRTYIPTLVTDGLWSRDGWDTVPQSPSQPTSPPLDGLADAQIVRLLEGRPTSTVEGGPAACRHSKSVRPKCPL